MGFGQSPSTFGQNSSIFGQNSSTLGQNAFGFNSPSTGFGGMFSSTPSLTSVNAMGFGQTPTLPFQSTQPPQSAGSFGFGNFGQTASAGSSGFCGGTSSLFAQNTFWQPSTLQNSVVPQLAPANPFGTLPVLPQMSFGRAGNSPSIQYGISSLPVLGSCDQMDSSHLIASIATALSCLQFQKEWSTRDYDMKVLGVVRTFVLCLTKLATNVQLRNEDNHDNDVPNSQTLGSLLVKVEDVVSRISDDHISCEHCYLTGKELRAFEKEMDKWYTCLLDHLQHCSTSPVGRQIKDVADFVLENLKDCLSSKICLDDLSESEVRKIKALEKNITFARNLIRFGTLFRAENEEFQCFLTHIQPLVVGAAHLVLSLIYNSGRRRLMSLKGSRRRVLRHLSIVGEYLTSFNISALLLNINHVDNPLLHERYTLALTSLKHSGKLHYPTLDMSDDPPLIIMEDFIVSLLSTLWEMLQSTTHLLLFLEGIVQALHQGLRLLRTLVKNQPDKFDDDKIRNIAAVALCDAGVIVFSLHKVFVIHHGFRYFQDNIEVIRAEVLEELVVKTPRFKYSETNVLGFLDFLLEDYLADVKSSSASSFVQKIREYLVFLKSFMGKLALRNQQKNIHHVLWNLSVEVVYKIELLIDQLVLGDTLDSLSMLLQSITEDIMTIEVDSLQIFNDEGRQEIFKVQHMTWPTADKVPSLSSRSVVDEVVGFGSEKDSIVNRLTSGFQKLKVVAVIGMPGLGKTTLATTVYSTLSISHYFPVKARCSISQVLDRKKVLLELLNQIQPGESNSTMNEDDLTPKLWRSLRKRRYLIFIDDIWDTEAFDWLRGSLPDDSNQSRILLTSRHGDVVPEALLDEHPLFLRHLTVDESLELLQRKLFPTQKDWPSELHEFGMEIAKYCKGLPLTVVIIAGLLKDMEREGWKDVLKALRSSANSDLTDECESTIELSYKHLPDHLKPCFLWFGAFPEDHEFSVKKLIWLWIAEGLVRKCESKRLEDVAADYLKNLIRRSLVMSVKERTMGGIKACRIHDLLRDFCLKKAKEDNFLWLLKVKGDGEEGHLFFDEFEMSSFDEPKQPSDEPMFPRRLCIYADLRHLENYQLLFPGLRSLLLFTQNYSDRDSDLSFIFRIFKLLRVLDVGQVFRMELPSEVGHLVLLRYLEIQVPQNVCPTIGKLSNLETLILNALGQVCLPDTLWNLWKLRHIYCTHGSIKLLIDNSDSSCKLLELETVSFLRVTDLSVLEKQLRKFPNIRRIKCEFAYGLMGDSKFIDFSFLSQLESLSLYKNSGGKFPELTYSENIKKLTLSGTNFPWNKIASIAKLPHLEVLKLCSKSFLGDTWHIEEGEFPNLKYLKLSDLNLVNWTASEDLFPNLERLVLDDCHKLEEIPEGLGNVANLKTIEVIDCSDHVVSLAKRVEEFQKEFGNSALQFYERRIRYREA